MDLFGCTNKFSAFAMSQQEINYFIGIFDSEEMANAARITVQEGASDKFYH